MQISSVFETAHGGSASATRSVAAADRVLVVEDDGNLAEMLAYNLTAAGFDVISTGNGAEALELARYESPDLVLLDWNLPGLPGIEVCRRLRSLPETAALPILMLTARTDEADRIHGLETGADDFQSKPYSPRELVLRVQGLLRRHRSPGARRVLEFGDLSLDIDAMKVTRAGAFVPLGPTEFRLLRHFMESPRRVFSREQLIDQIWGSSGDVEVRSVDVHIRRLRKAINLDDTAPDLIRTVRSAGYALDNEH